MRWSRAVALGSFIGLVLALACGQSTVTATSLLVRVFFNPSLGTKSLFFVGSSSDGVEVFPRSQRPEGGPDGGSFASPQTVRILLLDTLAAKPLTLTVTGLNENDDSVEAQAVTVTPRRSAELDVEIHLKPYAEPTDGGEDAGADAGKDGRDGGACRCDAGCCGNDNLCAPGPNAITVPGFPTLVDVQCGPTGQFCTAKCQAGSSDRCTSGRCLCGTVACQAGQRCDVNNGPPRCVCDAWSGCNGCCGGTLCFTSANRDANHCGNSALQCNGCPSDLSCNPQGVCGLGCGALGSTSKCCSAADQPNVQFPICRHLTGVCFQCDPYRSTSCDTVLARCQCGSTDACANDSVCLRVDGGAPHCTLIR